ncbi:DUF554 domain-containing protein [Saccharicrinis sp. FJH54]|uniref:DUF554 domain-containing protein n=1 Tax=unclassified Saccharicrinis TaxID=2646859 RepID=UPI0035D47B20
MLGTLINAGAIIIGSIIGLLIHSRMPKNITRIVFQGIGLFTLFLGIHMAAKTGNFLVLIFSIVLGAIAGELLRLDLLINRFSEWLKKRVKSKNENFSNGFVTSFLLYCMGSMAILGAFEEGLGGDPNLLLAKSVLDGFSSIALAASLGIGVIFSAIPLIIYQGSLTLFAGSLQNFFTDPIINELTAVGGLLLIGLGINILEIKNLKIINMIPSLIFAVILSYFFL